MSELLLLAAVIPLVSLSLILLFLLVVYLKGGKDDLKAAADAIHKVRSTVGVAAAIRVLGEAVRSIRRSS